MTTIAIDNERKAIATDSQGTGDTIYDTVKLYEMPDGTLLAFAGTIDDAMLFVEWYRAGANRKKLPDFSDPQAFQAVTMGAKGSHFWSGVCVPHPVTDKRTAFGSGGLAARVAMHCGKSIEEAVEVACIFDKANSGLPVAVKQYAPKKVARKTTKKRS